MKRSDFSVEMGEGETWCHSPDPKGWLTDVGTEETAHKLQGASLLESKAARADIWWAHKVPESIMYVPLLWWLEALPSWKKTEIFSIIKSFLCVNNRSDFIYQLYHQKWHTTLSPLLSLPPCPLSFLMLISSHFLICGSLRIFRRVPPAGLKLSKHSKFSS